MRCGQKLPEARFRKEARFFRPAFMICRIGANPNRDINHGYDAVIFESTRPEPSKDLEN